jgi:hypothetical protein
MARRPPGKRPLHAIKLDLSEGCGEDGTSSGISRFENSTSEPESSDRRLAQCWCMLQFLTAFPRHEDLLDAPSQSLAVHAVHA